MRGISEKRRSRLAACLLAGTLAAGCGGSERQDTGEAKGPFRVEVLSATFPAKQRIAGRAAMKVEVRNTGTTTVPNVAMTVRTGSRTPGGAPSAFGQSVDDPRLADNDRPVWIVDRGPNGGATAYTNTWALGRLAPGQSKTFEWRVTAVQPGDYTIAYEVAPGLAGRARLASGSKASGRFRVAIDDAPQDASVGANGEVVRK